MANATVKNNRLTRLSDDVVQDDQVLSIKHKMMERLRWNSMLNSVSKMATFVAGVMIPVALSLIVPLVKDATTLSGAVLAVSGSGLGVGFLGVAVAATLLAIGTDYFASRIWQASNCDCLEVNAQSTAHHLVDELGVTQDRAAPHRNDGKCWGQFIDAQRNETQQGHVR